MAFKITPPATTALADADLVLAQQTIDADGKQHQQFSRTCPNGTQDRQLAPAGIQAGEDHGHQASQPNQGDQPRNQQQSLLTLPDDFPDLIQRHTGQHAPHRTAIRSKHRPNHMGRQLVDDRPRLTIANPPLDPREVIDAKRRNTPLQPLDCGAPTLEERPVPQLRCELRDIVMTGAPGPSDFAELRPNDAPCGRDAAPDKPTIALQVGTLALGAGRVAGVLDGTTNRGRQLRNL